MSRGKVRIKKIIPKGSDDDTELLNDMFSQMTGTENADVEIIIPKFCKLHGFISKYIKIYQMLLKFNEFIDRFPEHKENFNEIALYVKKLEVIVAENENYVNSLKNCSKDEVNRVYKKLKAMKEIQTIVITSGNLGKHKRYLENSENLGDEFIKREPGLSLTPLAFTNLDLKILWASDKLTSMAKKYILNIISHTYLIGHDVYRLITSPDVDIKKFSKILVENIEKMKKQIPRCDKAFDVIAKSVSMLENNFEGYYKTSVEAENPSIIIESFIIDVSMGQKANPTVTAQFRKIIMFMKRQSANNKDPRVSKLFKILNNQFSMLQKETGIDPKESAADPKETAADPEESAADPEETVEDPEETAADPSKEEKSEEEDYDLMKTINEMFDSMKCAEPGQDELVGKETAEDEPDQKETAEDELVQEEPVRRPDNL